MLETLNLSVTAEAEILIRNLASTSGLTDPIACLMWTEKPGGDDPGWTVGFWPEAEIDEQHIVQVEGNLRLVVEIHFRNLLKGRCLDVENGYFSVD